MRTWSHGESIPQPGGKQLKLSVCLKGGGISGNYV